MLSEIWRLISGIFLIIIACRQYFKGNSSLEWVFPLLKIWYISSRPILSYFSDKDIKKKFVKNGMLL